MCLLAGFLVLNHLGQSEMPGGIDGSWKGCWNCRSSSGLSEEKSVNSQAPGRSKAGTVLTELKIRW